MRPLRTLRWMIAGLFVVFVVAVALSVILPSSDLLTTHYQCPTSLIDNLGPKMQEVIAPNRDQMKEYLHYPGSIPLGEQNTWVQHVWVLGDPPEKVFNVYKQKMLACSSHWGANSDDVYAQFFPTRPHWNGTVIDIHVRRFFPGTEITIEFEPLSYSN